MLGRSQHLEKFGLGTSLTFDPPVVAAAAWIAVLVGVAVRRFGREEF